MPEEPALDYFHGAEVAQNHASQDEEEERWRLHETQGAAQRGEWQSGGCRYHGQGTDCQPGIGTTLEGIASGADDKDNQHLGSHGFNEPSGMEKLCTGMKNMQHHIEGQKVKNRADRSENKHEVADEVHVPVSGTGQIFLIDVIERDRDFGKIVEQVVEQYLERQHGEKGKDKGCACHAEHGSEVRTCSHHDIL